MITLAKDGMRTDLEKIWRACFDDPDDAVRYFFDFRYNPNACAVYIDEGIGRPVAMIHMLEGYITEDSEICPVMYIYAAAVRPDYQGKGIMKQLLDFACRCANARRQKYMIAVPETRDLFRYYEKQGFYRCFKVRNVFMTRKDLIALSGYGRQREEKTDARPQSLTLTDLHAVRRDVLVDREGFVTWDFQSFKYAAGVFELQGGSIVAATDGFDAGYAFCSAENGRVFVSELVAHNGFTATVIRKILDAYSEDEFELYIPVFDEFFAPFGEIIDFGMIKAANGRYPVNILTISGAHLPYLGMALD